MQSEPTSYKTKRSETHSWYGRGVLPAALSAPSTVRMVQDSTAFGTGAVVHYGIRSSSNFQMLSTTTARTRSISGPWER